MQKWMYCIVNEKSVMCKLETPTCHVARQEGHGWALALNGTPNRRPRFYAVKLYSSLFKCILHRIAPFKCFIHPPLVALFTLAMISKLFGGWCIAVVVKHLIHTRQFQSPWQKTRQNDYFFFTGPMLLMQQHGSSHKFVLAEHLRSQKYNKYSQSVFWKIQFWVLK